MNIIEDTRQKKGSAHAAKHKTWEEAGDNVYRCALPYGDYALPPEKSVDTKANLEEIASNLCGSKAERERVMREEKLAQTMDATLIFVIETYEAENKTDLIGKRIILKSGKVVKGEELMKSMNQHEAVYGSEFYFCKPGESGDKVKELLKRN